MAIVTFVFGICLVSPSLARGDDASPQHEDALQRLMATVKPGSPQGADAIRRLRMALDIDHANARDHMGCSASIGVMYNDKADEVDAVLRRLEQGQPVGPKEIDNSLNNDEVRRLSY